ncbi:hypothetical protein LUZ63_021503 [Rhynchospora breviuscula]|uniref:Amino acid transporter n=1 Tax=Rhynchospora breviuscula TaxID=2022672 RepID=A0A9P9Z7G2_9POAL|nr:hypothetical protein LUZ63_021503 [Rhynchospora breviuscula]
MSLSLRTTRDGRPRKKIDRNHWLYISVIVAVVAGIVVGLVAPAFATGWSRSGRASALNIAGATYEAAAEPTTTQDFILGIIPTTFFSAFTGGSILQVLFIALLVGFALQGNGRARCSHGRRHPQLPGAGVPYPRHDPVARPDRRVRRHRRVVGKTGFGAVISLGILMGSFYLTCFLFIAVVLGLLLFAVTRVNIFSLMKYLGREYLLIVGTSSSEAALPRLIAKMEHLGVSKPVVGITVPDRLLVQPRRHRHLPDDGVPLHRDRHGRPDVRSPSRSAC